MKTETETVPQLVFDMLAEGKTVMFGEFRGCDVFCEQGEGRDCWYMAVNYAIRHSAVTPDGWAIESLVKEILPVRFKGGSDGCNMARSFVSPFNKGDKVVVEVLERKVLTAPNEGAVLIRGCLRPA
jgi:hypothetical protein